MWVLDSLRIEVLEEFAAHVSHTPQTKAAAAMCEKDREWQRTKDQRRWQQIKADPVLHAAYLERHRAVRVYRPETEEQKQRRSIYDRIRRLRRKGGLACESMTD